MRVNLPLEVYAGGNSELDKNGATLTSSLLLTRDPLVPLEAVTKRQVDNKFIAIPASAITSGILSSQRLPALSGDVTSVSGSGKVYLSSTGITPGSYTKFTVNNKGRVIAVNNLSADDIPSFSWEKITTGKPTTLAGYGIADALCRSGGALTGYLTQASLPTQTLHAANKQYVDSAITASSGLSTGDIIRSYNPATPSGFLRCNGGLLLQASYSALYAIIGSSYNVGTVAAGYFALPDYGTTSYYYIKY